MREVDIEQVAVLQVLLVRLWVAYLKDILILDEYSNRVVPYIYICNIRRLGSKLEFFESLDMD